MALVAKSVNGRALGAAFKSRIRGTLFPNKVVVVNQVKSSTS
jgi:hypothetical protein